MAPPQLPGNAPILNVAHPRKIQVFILLRHKPNATVLDSFNGRFCQHFGIDIPLVGQPWLDNHARPVATRHFQGVRVGFFQKP